MPNVKAPEYYAVTGESPPTMPDIDELTFLSKIRHPPKKEPMKEIIGEVEEKDSESEREEKESHDEEEPQSDIEAVSEKEDSSVSGV